jgi:hypothetical protein
MPDVTLCETARAVVQSATLPDGSPMTPGAAAHDELSRQVHAGLAEGRLPSVYGVSKSRRGTGRPCVVCRQAIEPAHVEREVCLGVVLQAHEDCDKTWREQSGRLRKGSLDLPEDKPAAAPPMPHGDF